MGGFTLDRCLRPCAVLERSPDGGMHATLGGRALAWALRPVARALRAGHTWVEARRRGCAEAARRPYTGPRHVNVYMHGGPSPRHAIYGTASQGAGHAPTRHSYADPHDRAPPVQRKIGGVGQIAQNGMPAVAGAWESPPCLTVCGRPCMNTRWERESDVECDGRAVRRHGKTLFIPQSIQRMMFPGKVFPGARNARPGMDVMHGAGQPRSRHPRSDADRLIQSADLVPRRVDAAGDRVAAERAHHALRPLCDDEEAGPS